MKKKLIALFLIATLLSCVFAFAACDKDKDKGGNGNANEAVSEEEIVSIMGKIATYIITKSNQDQMSFAKTQEPPEHNCEEDDWSDHLTWTFSFGDNMILNYESEDVAKKAIPGISEEFKGCEIKQRGSSVMFGSEAFFNEILNGEDRSVELLSQEFVDEYKSIFKWLLNSDIPHGYIDFYLSDLNGNNLESNEEYKMINAQAHLADLEGGKDTMRYIAKLVDNATPEELGAFEKYCKEKGDSYKKINDRLYFMSETYA